MEIPTVTRTVLIANEGKILNDGSVYGTEVYLEEDRNPLEFREMVLDEFESMIKNEESDMGEKQKELDS